MRTLSKSDWRKLDQIISDILQLESIAELKHFLLEILPPMLGATFSSWNEHNEKLALEVIDNTATYHERVCALADTLNKVSWSNPCFSHFFDTSTGKIKLMETVESTRDLDVENIYHQTEFYKKVGSKLGVEDQLHMHLFIKGNRGTLINFHSNRRFTPSEHLLCSILRGHILARLYTISQKNALYQSSSEHTQEQLQQLLTSREYETLIHLCKGISNSEIAEALEISTRTAEKHVSQILKKLELQSRNQVISTYGGWLI